METVAVRDIFKNYKEFSNVKLVGWVRSNRDNGSIGFISFTDGSCIHSIQLVYKNGETNNFEEAKSTRTGSAILVEGVVVESKQPNQSFEIKVTNFILLKQADEDYPLQKKEHGAEFLRTIAHLRQRTNKYGTIMRLRSELAFAIHNFFHQNNFVWVSSPIITSNDAEGAGENFYVDSKTVKNFFGKNASLTVSGQMHAEAYAQSYKRVYTFGPTFRAEKSNTNRHVSEFWMVEPEIAFCNLEQLMYLIEEFVKYLIRFILKNCKDEMTFLNKLSNNTLSEKLLNAISHPFEKITYKKAIAILKSDVANKKVKFENESIYFGMDLNSEHEKYLCEKVFNKPLFIYDYPAEIKAFYMKMNADGTTVGACDLLMPGIGEIVGGSERESDYTKLVKKCTKANMKVEDIEWYLALRKYGYHKSAGFGLGFERFLMYVTECENVKDTIPFPRSYGSLDF
ncbi:asparagine--tRNA ligase [Malacoplasma penetrans]|uniref:Asparagine--tRNA ligase n=1 Tax=Malacoplasma penetrans (strain HF-2) TaxID=272633 RepID=SYN_MALP2|nr:asparagine--tRNA ligase [Malacoplasma penetrans]Q8EW03.1 RecName: Full=Asparagine--tRNA ligase; AltName: Full=Asparaginyl-tRNA synthetase; Short=AsnRS [Malacoplasma penetrans HF-2]RXY97200.1 asparagine--tRNA ligase [Malacoplasma penetrans]BAC44194.1 asparaginyl-tRNA synthetase [Malacoplasma penetrans HF-2]